VSWEQGYDAGNAGLVKAVETAKLIGAVQERERIIKLLEDRKSVYKELMDSAESRGALPTAIHWEEMIIRVNSHIALIKEENE
jgi:hypothetical protein